MKPYYQSDSVTLYHADCRELLPEIWCDLLVTDPPYGIEFQSNYRSVAHDAIQGDCSFSLDLVQAAMAHTRAAAYVFTRWDMLRYMPHPKSVIAWVKNNWSMGDLQHEHGRQWEACCFYPRHAHKFIKRIPDVIHADRTGNDLHPTEKPTSLLRRIIANNVGQIVFDPFAGSGSTLVAAWLERRESIGIEIAEKYCEVIAKRLEAVRSGLFAAVENSENNS